MIQNKQKKSSDEKEEWSDMIQEIAASIDFKKVFNYLYETIRGLLIYVKEGHFDNLFVEENLIEQLVKVILKCYCEHSELIIKMTSQVVN